MHDAGVGGLTRSPAQILEHALTLVERTSPGAPRQAGSITFAHSQAMDDLQGLIQRAIKLVAPARVHEVAAVGGIPNRDILVEQDDLKPGSCAPTAKASRSAWLGKAELDGARSELGHHPRAEAKGNSGRSQLILGA